MNPHHRLEQITTAILQLGEPPAAIAAILRRLFYSYRKRDLRPPVDLLFACAAAGIDMEDPVYACHGQDNRIKTL
jgi:hypothetical protein